VRVGTSEVDLLGLELQQTNPICGRPTTDAWSFARGLCATMFSSTRKSKRNKKLLKNIDNDVRWPLLACSYYAQTTDTIERAETSSSFCPHLSLSHTSRDLGCIWATRGGCCLFLWLLIRMMLVIVRAWHHFLSQCQCFFGERECVQGVRV
jgi:hypothetical protein